MSNIWFASDLHFGHKRIAEFRSDFGIESEAHNREVILRDWDRVVTKRDIVFLLGDVCFDMELMPIFNDLKGTKRFIRGNHDNFDTQVYLKYFEDVQGITKYKEFWLTHAPIHPDELRGKVNLHGHVHKGTLDDKRYFNICPENLWVNFQRSLVCLDEIREHLKS